MDERQAAAQRPVTITVAGVAAIVCGAVEIVVGLFAVFALGVLGQAFSTMSSSDLGGDATLMSMFKAMPVAFLVMAAIGIALSIIQIVAAALMLRGRMWAYYVVTGLLVMTLLGSLSHGGYAAIPSAIIVLLVVGYKEYRAFAVQSDNKMIKQPAAVDGLRPD